MSPREIAASALALTVLVPLAGCESSQDKSARLAKLGGKAFTRKGLDVKQLNANVKVTDTAVLQDKNGAATVVVMRNTSANRLVNVPVSIDVLGANRKSVFKNDAPGLEPSLVAASVLEPRSEFTWVDDQVTPAGTPQSVDVRIGRVAARPPSGSVPKVDVGAPTLRSDPVSGVEASGTVTNRSKVEQHQLIVYCVARRGAKVVAAGRSELQRLKAGQTLHYHVFFIGDPSGARLSVAAPATVLQ